MKTPLILATITAAAAAFAQTNTMEKTPTMTSTNTPAVVDIVIDTSFGTMRAELYADKAPITVANFLAYTDEGFFNGTIFHRVIPGFMIQGGGFTPDMRQKTTKAPIKNEAANGLKNDRGTLAMARTGVVDSATSQFFVNHKDNVFLNHKSPVPDAFGYCVFGKLTEGYDVLDKIAAVKTSTKEGHGDVPIETVKIISVTRETVK